MPISNQSKSTSPIAYKGPTVPDYNFSNISYKPIGSMDTFLGNTGLFGWGSTYYDKNFYPYISQADQRYENQSGVTWLGNSLLSLGLKTFAVGAPSLVGGITSMAASPISAFSDNISFQDVFDKNPLNQLAKGIDAQVNELAPLPVREDFSSKNFLQQLSRPSELISQNIDSLAFLAQSFTGAGMLSKLNIGGRLATRLGQVRPMYRALTSLEGPNLAKMADRINAITTNAILSTNEAAIEARDASESFRESLHAQRLRGEINLTDEEIKSRSDAAGFNIFWQNAATLAITNVPFVNLTRSFRKAGAVSTRANEYGLRLIGDNIQPPRKLTGFEKFFFDKGYAPGRFTQSLLVQSFSEGLEESMQHSIQKINTMDNAPMDFKSSTMRYLDEITSGEVLNLADRERGVAFGLGALLGGASTVVASAFGKGPIGAARSYAKNKDAFVKSLNDSYSTLISNSLAMRDPDSDIKLSTSTTPEGTKYIVTIDDVPKEVPKEEYDTIAKNNNIDPQKGGSFTAKGNIRLDNYGRPIVDMNKMARLAADATVFDELSDMIDAETLRSKPDTTKMHLLRRETVAKAAWNYLQAGAFDIFLDRLESMKDGSAKEWLDMGIETTDADWAKAEMDQLIKFAEELEKLYLTHQNTTIIVSTSAEDLKLNEERKFHLFAKGQRMLTLDSLLRLNQAHQDALAIQLTEKYGPDIARKVADIANLRTDFEQIAGPVLNNERDDVAGEVLQKEGILDEGKLKELNRLAQDSLVEEAAQAVVRSKELVEARQDLGKIFDRLLSPRTGLQTLKKIKGTPAINSKYQKVSLAIDNTLSVDKYVRYQEREKQRRRLLTTVATTHEEFYSQFVDTYLKLLAAEDQQTPYNFRYSTYLREIVELLLDKKPHIREEQINALVEYMIPFVKRVNELELETRAAAEEAMVDFDTRDIIIEDDVFQQQSVIESIRILQDLKTALGVVLDPATPIKLLGLNRPITYPSDAQLEVTVARDLVQAAHSIVNLSGFDGKSVRTDYTNLAAILKELDNLKYLYEHAFSKLPNLINVANETKQLITTLEQIKVLVITNLTNKEIQAKRQNQFYASAIVDLLLPYVDEAKREKLQQIAKDDAITASLVIQDLLKSTALPDLPSKITQAIDSLDNVVTPPSRFGKLNRGIIENIARSPVRGFRQYLYLLNLRVNDSAISKFLDDFDVISFVDTLLSASHQSSLSIEDRSSIISAYRTFLAASLTAKSRTSNATNRNIQSRLQTFIAANKKASTEGEKASPAPSSAQERVITELVHFLSAKKDTTPSDGGAYVQQFQNVAALKAPPGAGKSVLVTPATFSILGYTPDNILTGASKAPAAKVIQQSTKSAYSANTHEELRKRLEQGDIASEVKVIVLDEAGAMDPNDLYALVGAFTNFLNTNQDRNVKLLLIYDPNQVNKSAWGTPRIEQETFSLPLGYNEEADPAKRRAYETGQTALRGSELPWIQNITDITPLSSTYRSDVGEIVDLINIFSTSEKVVDIRTASTTDPLLSMKDNLGTFSEVSNQNLLPIVKKSRMENPSRSIAIIVGTDTKKQAYIADGIQAGLTNVQVLTAEECSGITIDEAYVDIEINDDKRFADNPQVYNQYVRTALSRASKFAYISRFPKNHTTDVSIPEKAALNASLNKSRYDEALTEKIERLKVFDSFNTEAAPTTEVPTLPTPPPGVTPPPVIAPAEEEVPVPVVDVVPTEDVLEEVDPTPPIDVLPIPEPIPQGAYSLAFPQSEAFTEIGTFAPIAVGDEVKVVRQVSTEGERLIVIKPLSRTQARIVGVISDMERPAFQARFNIGELRGEEFEIDNLADTSGKNILKHPDLTTIDSVTLKVSEGSHDVIYHYAHAPTADFKNVGVQDILARWATSMFGDPQTKIEDYEDVLENWQDYVQFRIYRRPKDFLKDFPHLSPDGMLSRPLMVIKDIKMVGGGKMRPQFIDVSPTILTKESEAAKQIGLQFIYEFMGLLNELRPLIAKQTWPTGIYSNMDLGMSITPDPTNVYYPFHKFIQALAKAEKGKPIIVASNELKDRLREVDPALVLEDLEYETINPRILEIAKKLYELVHGESEYKGLAQVAFNQIAATNYLVTLPSGRSKILRDYRTTVLKYDPQTKKVVESVDTLTGLSLLGPLTFEHNKGRSYNSLIKDKLLDTLKKYLQNAYQRMTGQLLPYTEVVLQENLPNRLKLVAQLVMQADQASANPLITPHLEPLSAKDLQELFVDSVEDNKFSKISEGFGLRTPLSLPAFSENFNKGTNVDGTPRTSRDLSLYSFIETRFSAVSPTQIGLVEPTETSALPITTPTSGVEESTVFKQLSSKIRELVDAGLSLEEVLESMQPTSSEEAVFIEQYYSNLERSTAYITRVTAINKLVEAQSKRTSPTLAEKIEDIFLESKHATDFKKTAARDYVRASILASILPEVYNASPYSLLDIARLYVKNEQEAGEVVDALFDLATQYGVEEKVFMQRLSNLLDATNIVAAKYGLKQAEESTIWNTIQNIVKVSSEFRGLEREGQLRVSASQIESQVDILTKLQEAIINVDYDLYQQLTKTEAFSALPIELPNITSSEDLQDNPEILLEVNRALTEIGIERSKVMVVETEEVGEELTDAQAQKVYEKFTPPNLLSYIKNLFKKRDRNETFKIVSSAFMEYSLGRKNWGLFKNGVIYVARNAQGKVGDKVIRHEVFHRIFWNYLTSVEQIRALDLARERYGNLSEVELEEKLATAFEQYQNRPTSFLRDIFRRILRFFNFTYNNMKTLEDFFESISSGYYRGEGKDIANIERNYPILREFGTLDNYVIAKRIFLETFESIYNAGRKAGNRAFSYDEAVQMTLDNIRAYVSNPLLIPGSVVEQNVIQAALSRLLGKKGKAARWFIETFFYATDVKKLIEEENKRRETLREETKELQQQLKVLEAELEAAEGDDISRIEAEIESAEETLFENSTLLDAETFDAELRNPTDKLTSKVKQRLVSIKYSDNGVIKYAEFGKAYSMLVSLVNQLDTSSLESFEQGLRSRIRLIGSSIVPDATGYYTSIRKATAAFLDETLNNVKKAQLLENRQIAFFNDANFGNEYVILSKDGTDLAGITYSIAKEQPDKYSIFVRPDGQQLDIYLHSIADLSNVSYDIVKANYYLWDDLNFFKSLISAVGSLRESQPYVGRELYRNYKYRNYYSKNRRGGTSAATETQIVYAFDKYVDSLGPTAPLFPQTILNGISTANNSATKRAALTAFIRLLGFKSIPSEVSDAVINHAFDKLQLSVASLSRSNFRLDPVEAIANEGSLVDALVTLLGASGSYVEVDSYIRGDGKRAYRWIDASFQSSLLNALSSLNPFTKFDHLQIVDGKLTTESRILAHNPYVNGNNRNVRIHGFVDHDSIKTTFTSKYLHSENLADYHQRNFIFGFLSSLASDGKTYIQFLPIPSNRRTIQGVKVNVLSKADATAIIRSTIEAQQNRPLPEGEYGNIVNYRENFKKMKFAGLEETDNGNVDTLTQKVQKHIESQAKIAAAQVNALLRTSTGNLKADDLQIEKAMNALGIKNKKFLSENEFSEKLSSLYKKLNAGNEEVQDEIDALKTARDAVKGEVVEQIFETFYYNFVVNSYALSQLIYGDETFYVSKEDQTKRIQITTATGDILLTDPVYGLPAKSRVVVLEDIEMSIPLGQGDISATSYRESYKETDAQGYMLPEVYELYARTYGMESDLDVTMKPVYFNINEHGKPESLKYSVVSLSDELVTQYPELGNLRNKMRQGVIDPITGQRQRIDQAVFRSSVKMGGPRKGNGLDPALALDATTPIDIQSTLHISNKFMRIQLNPAKSPDVTVANPSQLTAFQNTNGLNTDEIYRLHKLNALIISLGSRGLSRELFLSEKGTLTKGSMRALRSRLTRSLENIAGYEDVHDALTAVDENGRPAVSFNLPLIQEKAVASVASIASAASVSFRFPGSKLVLQSVYGTLHSNMERLKFKDKDGYTEVYLPESYRNFFSEGDILTPGKGDSIIAFRIPSTNYHSALTLKVKGFYPTPQGSQGNIIIAPSEIVFFHGSDYDIDTLFLIRKAASSASIDIPAILGQYFTNYGQPPVIEIGDIVGFTEGVPIIINGKSLHDYLLPYIDSLEREIKQKRREYVEAKGELRLSLATLLDTMEEDYYTLIDVSRSSAQNAIVHLYSTNLRDPKNRKDLLTPISFARTSSIASETALELEKLFKDETFIDDLIDSGILQKICK